MGVMGRGRRDKRNGLTGMRDHLHMSTSAIALEPRFMFDAAGVATAVDAATHDPTADAHLDTTEHAVDQALLAAAAQATDSGENGTSTTQSVEPVETAASVTSQAETSVPTTTEIMFVDGRVFDSEALI